MRYFDHCTTADELKAAYRKAAMENHPDRGGSDEAMREVNRQYEEAAARMAKGGSRPGCNEAADGFTFNPELFRAAVMAAVRHPDLVLELVGRWLWVSGNTYQHKGELKAAGYHWSKGHGAWYYHDPADAVSKGGKKTLDEIKDKYGCERITSTGWTRATLTA